jgi:hypothetical protein
MLSLVFSKFEKALRTAKYQTTNLSIEVRENNPAVFLRILHFICVDYSPEFYAELVEKGYALLAMKDVKFIKALFQLLVRSSGQGFSLQAGHHCGELLHQRLFRGKDEPLRGLPRNCQAMEKGKPAL